MASFDLFFCDSHFRIPENELNTAPISGVEGKVVLSFFKNYAGEHPMAATEVAKSGGLALIAVRPRPLMIVI